MITYILQVSFCWSVFLCLYFFLFRKETFFKLNRGYLLSTLIAGIFIPLTKYISLSDLFEASPAVEYAYYFNQGFDQIEITVSAVAGNSFFNINEVIASLYAVGVLLLLMRFIYGYLKIHKIYQQGEVTSFEKYQVVESASIDSPFSFFGKIFIPKNKNWSEVDAQKMLSHEQCHCEEWHSLDVVMIELLSVIFWFNPLIYIYKKELRNVHEYLADEYALNFSSVETYGKMLLQNIAIHPNNFLENSFFNAQIKKRIMMMTKSKSSKSALLKYIAAIPIMAMLLFFTAYDVTAQVGNVEPQHEGVLKVADEMPHFPGCEDVEATAKEECWKKEMLMFIYKNIKYPAEARENKIQGTNVASFIVEKDGSISNIKFTRSIGGGTEEECKRIIKSMPNWVPGLHDGKPVSVSYILPIKFKLEDNATEKAADNTKIISSDGEVIEKPESMPYFLDCPEDKGKGEALKKCTNMKLLQFIYKRIVYPEAAKKNGTKGVVLLSFVIDKNGSVRDPKIEKSLGDGTDETVLNTFYAMQNDADMKWAPGLVNGEAVNVRYHMPVKFKLE